MREYLLDLIRELCLIDGVSGGEDKVREFILSRIDGFCDYQIDSLGNIIGRKGKGGNILLDAHMDEVGFIVKSIAEDGMLKLEPVGGMDGRILPDTAVCVNGLNGVICCKPVHLMESGERNKARPASELAADIGAKTREEAEKYVCPGDLVSFARSFETFGEGGDYLVSPALDDRVGCALIIAAIREINLDFDFSFTVQEEVGCRGAAAAAVSSEAERALAVETTTAADTDAVSEEKKVCYLGRGPVISFMDRSTLYDKGEYETLMTLSRTLGIPDQPKLAVAGGNNMGTIHKAGEGKKSAALSVPARYLHSPAVVVKMSDVVNAYALMKAYIKE